MHIVVVGMNYRTAPVDLREKFTISIDNLQHALLDLKNTKGVLECVIVATCNRTEFYIVVNRSNACMEDITGFMEKQFAIPKKQFRNYIYMLEKEEAIQHLFRVASGLDSMIVGETQILGQVKDSFFLAQNLRTTSTIFNGLFKQAITFAKKAYNETSIGDHPVSVSYAAVESGKQILGSYFGKKAMIIGAGEMSELTIKHLNASGIKEVLVINRTFENAVQLAEKCGGIPCPWDELLDRMIETDIVISSTSATEYIVTKELLAPLMLNRQDRPLYLMDIAVPRDFDPAIAQLPNVRLHDIDDLQLLVESNLSKRREEAQKIEGLIEAQLTEFEAWMQSLDVVPVIQALHSKANSLHEETMDSLFKKLPDLEEREMKVIRKLTKSIVNQMLQDPILRIKEMSTERNKDEALSYFTKIFALEEHIDAHDQSGNKTKRASIDTNRASVGTIA